jgi:hypothetical protein
MKDMKYTIQLLNNIQPLFEVCVKQANRHGLEEIKISKARAREILLLIDAADKEMEDLNKKKTSYYSHLDAIFAV